MAATKKKPESINGPYVINKPREGWTLPDIHEVWQFRYMLAQLVDVELRARYKQTIMGVLWAVLSPMIMMVVFTIVFSRLANVPSYNIPYPIFAFAGLVPWTLFSKGLAASATSIVASAAIIGKVYFPRVLVPLSKVFTGFIDFLLALVVLFVMMLIYGFLPDLRGLSVIFFALLAMLAAFGVGLWLSALHVRFRDIGHLVPFMVQALLYLSPVAYPSNLLTEPWRTLSGINPMVTVCDGFRWALLGLDTFHAPTVLVSTVVTLLLVISGLYVFQRLEDSFPDLV
ncbi:MAG: ABC transporter permease [Phototrophicaceae bacterium]